LIQKPGGCYADELRNLIAFQLFYLVIGAKSQMHKNAQLFHSTTSQLLQFASTSCF